MAKRFGRLLSSSSGLPAALALAGAYTDVMAFAAADQSLVIRDTGTPANTYSGAAFAKRSFTRATAATRIGSSGLVEAVPSGAARTDYSPATYALLGLLVEPARTNLVLYASDYSNAVWGKSGNGTASVPVITPNAGVAPDGTATASRVQMTLNGGTAVGDVASVAQTTNTTASQPYTDTVWVKANAAPSIGKVILRRGAAAAGYTPFTLTADWQRITLTETAALSAAAVDITLRGTFGSANDVDMLVWGAQREQASVPTSYLPTVAAPVARNADDDSLATTAFPSNAAQGTVVIAARTPVGAGATVLWQRDDGTESKRFRLTRDAANALRFIVTDGGVEQANISLGAVAASTDFKVAAAWAANDFAASLNGAAVVTDTAGTLPAVTTDRMGRSATGEHWSGQIKTYLAVPQRIANATLQSLST